MEFAGYKNSNIGAHRGAIVMIIGEFEGLHRHINLVRRRETQRTRCGTIPANFDTTLKLKQNPDFFLVSIEINLYSGICIIKVTALVCALNPRKIIYSYTESPTSSSSSQRSQYSILLSFNSKRTASVHRQKTTSVEKNFHVCAGSTSSPKQTRLLAFVIKNRGATYATMQDNIILSIMLYTREATRNLHSMYMEDGREYYFSNFQLQRSVYDYLDYFDYSSRLVN
jgi:hypothetical protein